MNVGTFENLIIDDIVDFGAYLKDEDNKRILLPKKQIPKGANIGDTVTVFIYNDSKSRLIATTKKPFLTVGQVAKLQVVDVNDVGAFLNFGLERDLLLPYSEQLKKVKIGEKVDILMYVDKSNRLCATMFLKGKNIEKKIKNVDIRTKEYEQHAERVYKIIKEKFKGHLSYTDKNVSSEVIKNDFGISKNIFKDSIGKLLKENRLKITDKGIFLYY